MVEIKNFLVINIIVFMTALISGCSSNGGDSDTTPEVIDYRQEMRSFVQNITSYSKAITLNFIIIPQNGHEMI